MSRTPIRRGSSPQALHIAVCGQAGTGKTTLVPLIADQLGLPALLEDVAALPAYAAWLEGRGGLFEAQQQFLERAFRLQQAASAEGGVQERPIYENYEVAVRYYFAKGMLADAEFETLTSLYRDMCNQVRRPDLLVYLTAPAQVLVERRRRRGKLHDIHVSAVEVRELQAFYEAMLKSWNRCPALTVDTSSLSRREATWSIVSEARRILGINRE